MEAPQCEQTLQFAENPATKDKAEDADCQSLNGSPVTADGGNRRAHVGLREGSAAEGEREQAKRHDHQGAASQETSNGFHSFTFFWPSSVAVICRLAEQPFTG